ncbi:hypothetical protein GCM10020331_007090 [Ectobacillus funiculus]
MTMMQKYSHSGILNWREIQQEAADYIQKLHIKVSSPEQKVINLSGGNQQKGCFWQNGFSFSQKCCFWMNRLAVLI